MSAADVKSARSWLVAVAVGVLRDADNYSKAAEWLLDKAALVTACAELPDEMMLRVRCTPNVFHLKA